MQNIRCSLAPSRRLVAVGALVLVTLGVAACSSTINGTTLEQEVASQVAAQQQVPASEVSVDCPDTIDVAQGTVTTCQATIAGEAVTIDVTQLDGDGSVEWVIVTPEDEETSAP